MGVGASTTAISCISISKTEIRCSPTDQPINSFCRGMYLLRREVEEVQEVEVRAGVNR